MQRNHEYNESCPCEDCLRITFTARFGTGCDHEIMSAGKQIGNLSVEYEVIGNPQSEGPRSSGYGA
jgi:hypothetical protein